MNGKKQKFLVLISLLLLIVFFNGCKNSNISDELYDIGKDALRAADDYMDYKLTADETITKIDGLYKQASYILADMTEDDQGYIKVKLIVDEIDWLADAVEDDYEGKCTRSDLEDYYSKLKDSLHKKNPCRQRQG